MKSMSLSASTLRCTPHGVDKLCDSYVANSLGVSVVLEDSIRPQMDIKFGTLPSIFSVQYKGIQRTAESFTVAKQSYSKAISSHSFLPHISSQSRPKTRDHPNPKWGINSGTSPKPRNVRPVHNAASFPAIKQQ